jgi:hypothetical protein
MGRAGLFGQLFIISKVVQTVLYLGWTASLALR